jgi:hypothetical protein
MLSSSHFDPQQKLRPQASRSHHRCVDFLRHGVLLVLSAPCQLLVLAGPEPLRIANMIGCAFFAIFGALTGAVTTFLLYLLMIPINAYRLRQMLALVKKARTATQGDMSMEWLKPFMTDRKYRKGDILMKKGDVANEMLLTVTGKFRVIEINVELPPGRLMGELGFLTPDNRRTATIECIEDGRVLTISYEKLLEIYFQNPQFGYYFLVLTSQRLLENLARAEAIIAQNKIAPQTPFAN